MKCAICGFRIDSIDRAVDQGRTPCFRDGKTEHEVAFPACTRVLLQEGDDGDMEVKKAYRGELTYLDGEAGKEDSEKVLRDIEIFFPRENEERRY